MPLKEVLISDIELRLQRGKPSDDFELPRTQIAHWMDSERDAIVATKLNEMVRKRMGIDPFYISRATCSSPSEETNACEDVTCEYNRYSVTLLEDILSLDNDRGLVRITDQRGNTIDIVSENSRDYMTHFDFGAPKKNRQIAYREGRTIFIEPFEEEMLPLVSYNIFYIPAAAGFNTLESEEYPIDDSLIPELVEKVEVIGLRQLSGEFEDLENDGKQA